MDKMDILSESMVAYTFYVEMGQVQNGHLYFKNATGILLPYTKAERSKHENFDFVILLSSSSSITLNSKAYMNINILYMFNKCSTTGEVSFQAHRKQIESGTVRLGVV